MSIYKRCAHKGRERDRCDDEWYGSYMLAGHARVRVSLAKWVGKPVATKSAALAAFDLVKQDVRARTFKPEGRNIVFGSDATALTLAALIAAYKKEGTAISRRENVHRMADANKAFAHFAW